MARWTAFFEQVKVELPEYADKMADRRAMFGLMREEAFKAKVEAHAVLGPKWKALRANMGSGRSRGGRTGGGEGRRPQGGDRASTKGDAG